MRIGTIAAIVMVVALALVVASPACAQGKVWKDLSWWGKSGATPDPVKDKTRSGSWWWPTEAKSNEKDAEAWGNRGVVYHIAKEEAKPAPAPAEAAPAPAPAPSEPVKVKREKPLFNNVLFDLDKAILKPEGKAEVDKVNADLKAHPKDTVIVQGHTCDLASDAYNMKLSDRRANAVKAYMVEQGIDAARVTATGFGESMPAVPNDSEANRKLNRRAMFDITVADE